MRGKWRWLLALAVLLCIGGLSACGKKTSLVATAVKRADTTWFLYAGTGKKDTLSFQFNKNDAVVKAVDAVGETAGQNKLNGNFANPKYTADTAAETLRVDANQTITMTFLSEFTGRANGQNVVGYNVRYDNKTYHFVRLKRTPKKQSASSASTPQSSGVSGTGVDSELAAKLMKSIVNVNDGAEPLQDKAFVGTYTFRMFIGQNVGLGQITINENGTYQNAITELNTTNPADVDKASMISYSLVTGQLEALYGKEYLNPRNLLTVAYTVHGQNIQRRLPQRVTLWTNGHGGNHINLARARVENTGQHLIFYSKDYTPWPKEGLGPVETGLAMTKADGTTPQVQNIYTTSLNAYRDIQKTPVNNNADFMQLLGAISDAHHKTVGQVAVDFSDRYGAGVKTTDYQGVAKDGSKQPQMQYVFVVSPAKVVEGATYIINTQSGSLLVFGMLNNKLYLLHQPDPDSATVTWIGMNDVDLTVPPLQIRLNPGL